MTNDFVGTLEPYREQVGLTPLIGLLLIAKNPGISVSEFASELGVPQASASRYVSIYLARYQKIGEDNISVPLISQNVSESDPRKRSMILNEEGKRVLMLIGLAAGNPSL